MEMESDTPKEVADKGVRPSLGNRAWVWIGKLAVALGALYYGNQLFNALFHPRPQLEARCTYVAGSLDLPTVERERKTGAEIAQLLLQAKALAASEALLSDLSAEVRRDPRVIGSMESRAKQIDAKLEEARRKVAGGRIEDALLAPTMPKSFYKMFGGTSLYICTVLNSGDEAAKDIRIELGQEPDHVSIEGRKVGSQEEKKSTGKTIALPVLSAGDSVEIRIWGAGTFGRAPFDLFHSSGSGKVEVGRTFYGWNAWIASRDWPRTGLLVLVVAVIAFLLQREVSRLGGARKLGSRIRRRLRL